MALRLFHFTARIYLPVIMSDGIRWGDVPLSAKTRRNAVWLTSLHGRHKQQWIGGTKKAILDKSEIRLTVEIPSVNDPLLFKWVDFAKVHVDPQTFKELDQTGGGWSDHWYVYFGIIPWNWVVEGREMEYHEDLDLVEMPPTEIIEASRVVFQKSQEIMEAEYKKLGISELKTPFP